MTRCLEPTPAPCNLLVGIAADPYLWYDKYLFWTKEPGRNWERSGQTAEQANDNRYRTIHMLRFPASEDPAVIRIAANLERCIPRRPCMSAACPNCHRAFNLWFSSAAFDLIKKRIVGNCGLSYTAVPDSGGTSITKHAAFYLAACNAHVFNSLARAGESVVLGRVHLTLSEAASDRAESLVQFQYDLLFSSTSKDKLKEIQSNLDRSVSIDRPLVSAKFAGTGSGLAYAMTPNGRKHGSHKVRWRFLPDPEEDSQSSKRIPTGSEWIKRILLLDRVGFDNRLILLGLETEKTPTGLQLRVTSPA